MKLGLKLWSINTDCYYEEARRLFCAGWFDYVELYVVPGTLETLSRWAKLDIPFAIHAPHFAHGFNLAKTNKEEHNFKIYDEVKIFADELHVDHIIFHGGIDGGIRETARQLKNLNEPRALIENKPFKALPNKMGGEFCRGYNPEEIKYVKDETGCGFCLDFGHAVCAANSLKTNPYNYIETFLPLAPEIFHLTDIEDITGEYDSHPHLGDGQLDIKRILNRLDDNSKITIETVKNSMENLEDFVGDVKWLTSLKQRQ